ncbi:MAG: glycosyltransferase [Nanoarchaeota archaeon]
MKFSIIITSYNQPLFLSEAVESCYNQTYKEPFEIVVVDDSDIESTSKVLLPDRPGISLVYIKNEKNLGHVKSYNLGCLYTIGDWVIRLDGDDCLLPQALSELKEFLNEHDNKKLGFIYSDLMIMDENKIRKYPEWKSGSILDLQNIGHLQAIKKSVSEEIGHWDVSLKYSADTDAIIRVIEKGYQIKHIPKVLYLNRLHENQYTQKWVREGNDPQYWKNLIFQRALQKRPDIWIEGREQVILSTSGSSLWRSEIIAIQNWIKGLNFIDIGCSNRKKLSHAIGVDLDRNGGKCPEWVFNEKDGLPFKDGVLDGIIASHCVEHLPNPIETINTWLTLLKTEGRLILVVPDVNFTPKMGTEGCDPTHLWDFVSETFKSEILDKLDKSLFNILHHAQIGNSWSFLTVLERI